MANKYVVMFNNPELAESLVQVDDTTGALTLPALVAGPIAKFGNIYVGGTHTGSASPNMLSADTGNALHFRSGIDTTQMFTFRNASNTVVAYIDLPGTVIAGPAAIVTREKGDARYVLATAGSIGNPLQVGSIVIGGTPAQAAQATTISVLTGSTLTLRSGIDTNGMVQILSASGTQVARFDTAGTAMGDPQSVVTQEKGDARYVNIAGGSLGIMTGMLTAPSATFGAIEINVASGQINRQSSHLVIGAQAAGGIISFQSDGAYAARVEIPGTAVPQVYSVITREKGDARYPVLSGGLVPIAKGGTNADDAATARTNLGANSATNLTAGTLPAARLGATAADESWVRGKIASLLANEVGSYALACRASKDAALVWGSTYAGSGLSVIGFRVGTNSAGNVDSVGPTLSGTWRAMAAATDYNDDNAGGLLLRIS